MNFYFDYSKGKMTTNKTYFLRFDGELLGRNGRPFFIERIFSTHDLQKVFDELFDNEEGWGKLQYMFDHEFEHCECENVILGCPIPKDINESYDCLAAFVKYYVDKGHKKFFEDIDRTWVERKEAVAYAFVKSDDANKLLTIMKTCAEDDMIGDYNTDHLDSEDYYKGRKRVREN